MEIEQGATAEVEAPEVSMDDTILETLRSMQSENDDSAPVETTTPESPEEKAERIRDASGKFAKADTTETNPESMPETVAEEDAPEAWTPPNTWKKGAAEKLRNADPEIQAEVARRESDFHRGIEQYKEAAHFGHEIDRAIAPFIGTLNQLQITPAAAITELMKTDQALRYGSQAEKVALFHQLAQSYGIDINQAASYEAPYVDPQVSALQQQVSQMQSYFQQQNQMAEQQSLQALNNEIAQFAAKPEHKHFDAVRGHMQALLQAGHADTLESAYEQAVFANPQTRALVLAEQQAAQRAAAAEKAQLAKKAASVNVRSRSPAPQTAPVGTMDDTIRGLLRGFQS